MVPPEVTASRWAPGRPVTVPATRSQTTPRPQLREGVRGVAARQHVEDRRRTRTPEGRRTARPGAPAPAARPLPGVQRGHRDQLLGQHVQRVATGPRSASIAPARIRSVDHRRLHQIPPVLGEDHPGGDRAHLMPGPADPLQPGGHRGRRLDLDHQVDRAHVDAQLKTGGGDHRRAAGRPSAPPPRAPAAPWRPSRGAPWPAARARPAAAPEPPISIRRGVRLAAAARPLARS